MKAGTEFISSLNVIVIKLIIYTSGAKIQTFEYCRRIASMEVHSFLYIIFTPSPFVSDLPNGDVFRIKNSCLELLTYNNVIDVQGFSGRTINSTDGATVNKLFGPDDVQFVDRALSLCTCDPHVQMHESSVNLGKSTFCLTLPFSITIILLRVRPTTNGRLLLVHGFYTLTLSLSQFSCPVRTCRLLVLFRMHSKCGN